MFLPAHTRVGQGVAVYFNLSRIKFFFENRDRKNDDVMVLFVWQMKEGHKTEHMSMKTVCLLLMHAYLKCEIKSKFIVCSFYFRWGVSVAYKTLN